MSLALSLGVRHKLHDTEPAMGTEFFTNIGSKPAFGPRTGPRFAPMEWGRGVRETVWKSTVPNPWYRGAKLEGREHTFSRLSATYIWCKTSLACSSCCAPATAASTPGAAVAAAATAGVTAVRVERGVREGGPRGRLGPNTSFVLFSDDAAVRPGASAAAVIRTLKQEVVAVLSGLGVWGG